MKSTAFGHMTFATLMALAGCGGQTVGLGGVSEDGGSFGEGGGTESGTGDAFSGGAGQAGNGGSSGSGGFSGVSDIYMAIGRGGAQHRDLFFTNSEWIYCDVLFSSGKQDATVDFTIVELEGPGGAAPLHRIFAGDTKTPGPGTETPVAFLIPPNGIQDPIDCRGQCAQNGASCSRGYSDQGKDSAGPGATCCYNPTGKPANCSGVLPYPVGTFQCVVQIDGVRQSEAPTFQIDYPPGVKQPNGEIYICPVAPPVTGMVCTGWVPMGAKCAGYHAPEICTCTGATWNCVAP
jgi:hypothetical protein